MTVPISHIRGSAPLLNKGLFIQELHLFSSGVNGIPISMPPRHRPISSVHACSTSTNQIQEGGAGVSKLADSTAAAQTSQIISVKPSAKLDAF